MAVGVPFVLYLATLFPGVGDRSGTGDAIEFQYVGRILGVAHEPGYPQFVLISHLWTSLPLPLSLAVKVNLLSAVLTSLAGLFFYLTLERLGAGVWATVLATLTLLSAFDIWLLATQAEVYSLHLFWVSIVVWSAIRWARAGRDRDLIVLFFAYALSFGNHLTMIVLLPGLAVLVLWRGWTVILRWQTWVWATLAIGTGVLQYGLLVWRSFNPHPALPPWFPLDAGLTELWAYVSGDRFVDKHWLKNGVSGWMPRLWEVLAHGIRQLSPVLALMSAAGIVVEWRRDPRTTISLVSMSLCVVAFAAAYGIKDSLFYGIPAWLVLALFGGVGLDRLLGRWQRWQRPILVALCALLAFRLIAGVIELQVLEVKADLGAAIDRAEPGAGILAGRRERQARLADGYYRWGLESEKAATLSFHSTARVFRNGLEETENLPLYFQSPPVLSELEDRWVDYRSVPGDPSRPEVWVTGTTEPIRKLQLRSLFDRRLALAIRDRSEDLLGERILHVVLIDFLQRRSKGHATFDLGDGTEWEKPLDLALAVARPGDWLLVVEPATDHRTHTRVAELLSGHGVELGPEPFRFHAIAFWQAGSAAPKTEVIRDLDGRLEFELVAE